MVRLILFSIFMVIFSGSVFAQGDVGEHVLMTAQEQQIHNIAKKRLYPGGRDEESLKVQSQLPLITRKMTPATQMPVDDPSDEAHD